MAAYEKPLPSIGPTNRPFYEAARRRELRLQRCLSCGKVRFPISPNCPYCWSEEYEWAKLSGRGRVSSWVVYHQTFNPAFEVDLPYHVAQVDLEEGPRLLTNIVDLGKEELRYRMPVEAVFEDVTAEVTLVKFKPATS